jgi:hypothetical protein
VTKTAWFCNQQQLDLLSTPIDGSIPGCAPVEYSGSIVRFFQLPSDYVVCFLDGPRKQNHLLSFCMLLLL